MGSKKNVLVLPREGLRRDGRQDKWREEFQEAFSMRNHDEISTTDPSK